MSLLFYIGQCGYFKIYEREKRFYSFVVFQNRVDRNRKKSYNTHESSSYNDERVVF